MTDEKKESRVIQKNAFYPELTTDAELRKRVNLVVDNSEDDKN